jgi:hypothetical protein
MYSKEFVVKVANFFDQPTIPSNNSKGLLAVGSTDEYVIETKEVDN